jgi:hypothetical protein
LETVLLSWTTSFSITERVMSHNICTNKIGLALSNQTGQLVFCCLPTLNAPCMCQEIRCDRYCSSFWVHFSKVQHNNHTGGHGFLVISPAACGFVQKHVILRLPCVQLRLLIIPMTSIQHNKNMYSVRENHTWSSKRLRRSNNERSEVASVPHRRRCRPCLRLPVVSSSMAGENTVVTRAVIWCHRCCVHTTSSLYEQAHYEGIDDYMTRWADGGQDNKGGSGADGALTARNLR